MISLEQVQHQHQMILVMKMMHLIILLRLILPTIAIAITVAAAVAIGSRGARKKSQFHHTKILSRMLGKVSQCSARRLRSRSMLNGHDPVGAVNKPMVGGAPLVPSDA